MNGEGEGEVKKVCKRSVGWREEGRVGLGVRRERGGTERKKGRRE